MLQILSTSNETSTGPELVQNGNFSEVGSDLVTNGDFSAEGSNLVTNGDFATDTDWVKGTGITISGGSANFTGSANANINQDIGLITGKSYKIVFTISNYVSGDIDYNVGGNTRQGNIAANGTYTDYVISDSGSLLYFQSDQTFGFVGSIDNVSVKELGEDWTTTTTLDGGIEFNAQGLKITNGALYGQAKVTQPSVFENGKSYKFSYTIVEYNGGDIGLDGEPLAMSRVVGDHVDYLTRSGDTVDFVLGKANVNTDVTVTNIVVQELGEDWAIGTGWSIGDSKAISAVTGSNSDITQSILTAGKTYRTVYEIVDYTAGTAQAVVTGSAGADAVAIETYTESLTATGTDFSIRSKLGTFDGSVSSVSVKLLGTYEDQSIYVTAADVQTIAQASVYYLIELTSMASKNSLYFLPSSVVANNGRYTKLNFTVISKDALPQPTVGIISFYDSVGGFDTYPMGFYEFRIYEQTSSTNLDPLLATGLLEKGFAFVRDFSGNMQELTDGFKEYNPTLTQYVYSK